MMILRRGLLVWLLLMVVESLHGIVRRILLEPYFGDFRAHQIAVFTGSVLILAIASLCVLVQSRRPEQMRGVLRTHPAGGL